MLSQASRRRSAAVLLALTVGVSVTACSSSKDDDDTSKSSSSPSDSSSATDFQDQGKKLLRDCDTTVTISGGATASWSRSGEVTLRSSADGGAGPKARYRSSSKDGKASVTIYSTGPDFAEAATVVVGGAAYSTSPDGLDGLEAQVGGKKASADGVSLSGGGDEITLDATFTCGQKPGKKKHRS